ncbi:hypothetical protein Hamer_G023936 [Homarus americanus]|uniref:Uncharacterized protein n=1 Tax=Homarus americanus TaxID=6706 RepID=A0A8J5N510_HOMAM|nr:hypothetical protein Hamer_G023936 [Homarus americanus]
MARAAPLVVVVVLALTLAAPAQAAVLPGGSQVMVEPGTEYLHDLNSDLVTLLRQNLPEMRDIRIVDGPNGPRLDMPLSGCRDSLDCHHRFTNYLGLLVRMMETGKRRK